MARPKKNKELANEEKKGYDITDKEIPTGTLSIPESLKKGNSKTKSAFDKEPTKKESEAFSAFLGNVEKLSITESGRNNTIFIDSIKSTLVNDPAVKRCPLHFRWRKKSNVVNDGNGAVNKGYAVVSKKIMKEAPFKLTVSRDDTPTEDFYPVGDSVLCCTNKNNFEIRKIEAVLKSIRRPGDMKKQRNEFAKQQAKNNDVAAVTDNYANANLGDNKLMPSKFETPKDYGEMISKAKEIAGKSDTLGV
jgi:hypothetical protein